MSNLHNPVIEGFNPDPAICRMGDDYYIATSTFEWYPGVQIHHSRNLKDWNLVARPLNRKSLLDMRGTPDSCGVWAPCLSYADGRFWLCYTDVKRYDGHFKDTHNYLTSCATIDGKWSEPVYMNSSGFDPSLFHDTDGRKWFLNMVWDHRREANFFAGIYLQEYSVNKQKLTGEIRNICPGSKLGSTEGPHLYRVNSFYYLVLAEGGTGYAHAVTIARSRDIAGPYEFDPQGPVFTSANNPEHVLQRTGHGGLVETPCGEFYLTHLCSRPLPVTRRSTLGRETCIQKVSLNEDGWFRLHGGGSLAQLEVPALDAGFEKQPDIERDSFDKDALDPVWQWLRTPEPETFMSLKARPGYLRLYGRESIGSAFTQALVARRQTGFGCRATTRIDFQPDNFQQMAGLVCYYNASKFFYLYISSNAKGRRFLSVMACLADLTLALTYPLGSSEIILPASGDIYLRAEIREAMLKFSWSLDGDTWQAIDRVFDASLLSDEAGACEHRHFTGNFLGMACQDVSGRKIPADFSFFEYLGL